jgi:hypothetical protein
MCGAACDHRPVPVPFEGCSPSPSGDHAEWITDALQGRSGVAFVVPDRFDRCVRVHHALPERYRWTDVAPEYLVRGVPYAYPFPDSVAGAEGDPGDAVVDRLVEHLSRLAGGDVSCHYGLWRGWGDLHAGSNTVAYAQSQPTPWDRVSWCAQTRRAELDWIARARPAYDFVDACPSISWWGGREMCLFDGPLSCARSIGAVSPWREDEIRRRGPQWWWTGRRDWFVATEIDYPWSYVGGPNALVEAILVDDALEIVEVGFSDVW